MTGERSDSNASLLERARGGDGEALGDLAERNAGLVKSVALRFTGRGVELDDLIQTGMIGMLKAARRFDPSFGCAFSTYAVPLIAGEIKRMLRDGGSVKIGRELKRRASQTARARERLESVLGREPRVSELAAETGLSIGETAEALAAYSPVRSLSDPVGDDSDELGDLISDPSDDYERVCEEETLKSAISGLTDFERRVVYLRYGRELTQSQTGRLLGVSQVRISRAEKRILERLRAEMSS